MIRLLSKPSNLSKKKLSKRVDVVLADKPEPRSKPGMTRLAGGTRVNLGNPLCGKNNVEDVIILYGRI